MSKRSSQQQQFDDASTTINASMTTKHANDEDGDEHNQVPLLLSEKRHSSTTSASPSPRLLSELNLKFDPEQVRSLPPRFCPLLMNRFILISGILSVIASIVLYSIPFHFGVLVAPWSAHSSFNPSHSAMDMAIFDLFRTICILYYFHKKEIRNAFYASCLGVIVAIGKLWVFNFKNYDESSKGDAVIVFYVVGVSFLQCIASYLAASFLSTEGLSFSSVWKVTWPFLAPQCWEGKFAAVAMWLLLIISQACILYAPLQLAKIVKMLSPLGSNGGGDGGGDGDGLVITTSTTTSTPPSSSPNGSNGYINSKDVALAIAFYGLLKLAPKILNELRDLSYCIIWYHGYKVLSTSLFDHIHSLPFDFHLNKQLGELVQTVGDGLDAADNLVYKVVIQVVPTLVSTFVAFLIFTFHLDIPLVAGVAWLGFTFYLWGTLVLTKTKEDERDEFAEATYNSF